MSDSLESIQKKISRFTKKDTFYPSYKDHIRNKVYDELMISKIEKMGENLFLPRN